MRTARTPSPQPSISTGPAVAVDLLPRGGKGPIGACAIAKLVCWAGAAFAFGVSPLAWAQTGTGAAGTPPAVATTPAPGPAASMPAQKKPAKSGTQSGRAASGPQGAGASPSGADGSTPTADKRPAKQGAQSGRAPASGASK